MALLSGADRAAFAVALGHTMRRSGVPVTLTALGAFTEGLEVSPPADVRALYWLARLTLVGRQQDLAAFETVFRAVFSEAVLAVDPHARREAQASPDQDDDSWRPVRGDPAGPSAGDALPWHTLPRVAGAGEGGDGLFLPELLPSGLQHVADTPFDELDERELARVGSWLERSVHRWPTRPSRRRRVRRTGAGVALRETISASRRTGWEPLELRRYRRADRLVTVTLLCDVSQSMQGFTTAYLHLMRAFARTRHAETFAFATSLTRLTPALTHRSAQAAIIQATDQVVDRYGGTRLASSLRELLVSPHGNSLRGGVLVIASDGWDSEDPEALRASMQRVRRRARRVVWLNPRAAAPGFEPLVGPMSAALPYCDAFLPAHTLRALPAVLDAIADTRV